jgi:hypothetical protein
MYRVRNIVNRRESDAICHSVRRSWVPTSYIYNYNLGSSVIVNQLFYFLCFHQVFNNSSLFMSISNLNDDKITCMLIFFFMSCWWVGWSEVVLKMKSNYGGKRMRSLSLKMRKLSSKLSLEMFRFDHTIRIVFLELEKTIQ